MPEVLADWNSFLESGGGVLGLMLALAGGAFLVSGWRFGHSALIMTYALVGAVAGRMLGGAFVGESTAVLCGAGLFALLSVIFKRFSGPALAGMLGSMWLWSVLSNSAVPAPVVYIVLVMAIVVIGAFGIMNVRATSILLSSFTGAALLVSGLVAMALDSEAISPHFRNMSTVGLFYPFIISVATFSGFFVQAAAANRKDCGEIRKWPAL